MSMYDIDLKGKPVWRVQRCSEHEQEKDSFAQQEMTTDSCAARFGVKIVGTTNLAGMSATRGEQVEPILALIADKVSGRKQFDGFILDAYSRFARSDVDEARLYAACREANLVVLTDKEGLMMGPGTWAKRGASADQNEGYARDVGRHISRSVVKLVTSGLIPPTLCFPWGLDREYYDKGGTPLFRVRRLPDGKRVVMEPDAPYPVRFHISREKTHLDLRDSDYSFRWVPGDPEIVSLIQEIYRRHYLENVNYNRLCADLNRRNVPSPRGKLWTTLSVKCIVTNPIYLGKSIGFITSSGRHCERDKTGVTVFPVSRRAGYTKDNKPRAKFAPIKKPVDKWLIQDQPKLLRFIADDVRPSVEQAFQNRLNGCERVGASRVKRRNLPPKSRYFLSGILTIKGDERPMIGSDGPNRPNGVLRYYITRREGHSPIDGAPSERVRAEIVEEEVKKSIRFVLANFELHVPKLREQVDQKRRELLGRVDNRSELSKERAELEDWYRSVFSVSGMKGRDILAGEAARVEQRLEQIEIQLAELDHRTPEYMKGEIDDVIASIRHQMTQLQSVVNGNVHESLRNLAAALFSKLTFDPLTRTIEMEIGIPSWVWSERQLLLDHVGTGTNCDYVISHRTNTENPCFFTVSCSVVKRDSRHPCLECTRNMAA